MNKSKTYHLFISQARLGLSESDITANDEIAIKMMKDHLEKENPDTKIVLVVIYNHNTTGAHNDNRVWCLGTRISLMRDADICCFIGDSSMTNSDCIIEKSVCDTYGIPYVHFTDSDIADYVCKTEDCGGGWKINHDQFVNLYKHVTTQTKCPEFSDLYTVDTKNVPRDEISFTTLSKVNPDKLPIFIADYTYCIGTLINSGLLMNLQSFIVVRHFEPGVDVKYLADLVYNEHFPILTVCDADSAQYNILKKFGFIDLTGTWFGYGDDISCVMIHTNDDDLLRYIYEFSFVGKSQAEIENMNLPVQRLKFLRDNIDAILENMEGVSNDCENQKETF